MTQEDKELLLKDLCARLPYKVICDCLHDYHTEASAVDAEDLTVYYPYCDEWESIEHCKPYLRPLSSMTEEEKKDILQSLNINGNIDNEGNLILGVECNIITLKVCKKYLGELNKRMFDVCHIIEKGLALEAPKGMYKID